MRINLLSRRPSRPPRRCGPPVAHVLIALATWADATAAQVVPTHVAVTSGAAASDVVVLGDVDGDGAPDAALALPGGTAAVPGEPVVLVLSLAEGAVHHALTSASADPTFGERLLAVDDLDGDGVDDLVVSAPGAAGGATPGVVLAYGSVTGELLWSRSGDLPGDRFGGALARFGDHDDDGVMDVFVGADRDGAAGEDAGRCAVLSGVDGAVLVDRHGSAGDRLGAALTSLSPGGTVAHDPEPWIGMPQSGVVAPGAVARLDPTDLGTVFTVSGELDHDRFGSAITLVGDLDGDGVAEVLVGTDPRDATGAALRPGSIRLLDGADGALLDTHTAPSLDTGFGLRVVGVGDVDGDGVPDYAAGEAAADEGAADSGTLRVFSGADGSPLTPLHGSSADAQLGVAIAPAGDVDGDALGDIALVSRDASSGTTGLETLSYTPWVESSNGTPGTVGVPRLVGRGGLQPGMPVVLDLAAARPDASALLTIGPSLVLDAVQGVVSPLPGEFVPLVVGASGDLEHTIAWPPGVPSGVTFHFQVSVTDPAAAHGVALSNTISAVAP